MIRPLIALCLLTGLAAAEHGAWQHLEGEVLAAARWRGGTAAAAAAARQRYLTLFASPQLQTAAGEVVAAAAKAYEGFGQGLRQLTDRGFTWQDATSLFAEEAGVAVLALPGRDPDGKTQGDLAAWATLPDPLWARLLTALDAEVAAGRMGRQDLVRDGRTLLALTLSDGKDDQPAGVICRRDDGRCWALFGSQKQPAEARADRLASWMAATPGETAFARRVVEARVLGQGRGEALVELAIDIGGILRLARAESTGPAAATIDTTCRMLGADALGLAAMEIRIDGGWCRTALALQASGPRTGVMRLFDAAAAPAAPPAWLPAEAHSVSHAILDLAGLLDGIKQVMLADPKLRPHFEMAENAVPAFAAGLTMQQIAGALGRSLWQIDLPETVEQLTAGDDRKAVVLELADPAVISRLLPLANLAAKGRKIRFVTEQGAQGLRIAAGDETPEVGVFVSGQHLVVGIGSGVASEILAALARGEGRWAATAHATTGLRQLPARQLLLWAIEDSLAIARLTPEWLRSALDNVAELTEDEDLSEALIGLGKALPDAEAMAAAIAGPQTTAAYDDGGVLRVVVDQDLTLE